MLQFWLQVLALRSPQVLRFRDATTNQEISLVGTVHYNPASVARAKAEVGLALERNEQRLGALVVEACESRWNRSLDLAPPGSATAKFVESEMQGAAGVALQAGVPVMLGDADVGPFLERVRELGRQTARELLDPLGGWGAIYKDFRRTLPGTLNPQDVASSELLLPGESANFSKALLLSQLYTLYCTRTPHTKILTTDSIEPQRSCSLDVLCKKALEGGSLNRRAEVEEGNKRHQTALTYILSLSLPHHTCF